MKHIKYAAALITLLGIFFCRSVYAQQQKLELINGTVTPQKGFSEPFPTDFTFAVFYKGDRPDHVSLLINGPNGIREDRKSGSALTTDELKGITPITWRSSFPYSTRNYQFQFKAVNRYSSQTAGGGEFTVWPPYGLMVLSLLGALFAFIFCKVVIYWAGVKLHAINKNASSFAGITFILLLILILFYLWSTISPWLALVCALVEIFSAAILLRPANK